MAHPSCVDADGCGPSLFDMPPQLFIPSTASFGASTPDPSPPQGDADSLHDLEKELEGARKSRAELDGMYRHDLNEVSQLAELQGDIDRWV